MSRELRCKITCDRDGCASAVVGPTDRAAAARRFARTLGWRCEQAWGEYVDECPAHTGEDE